MVAGVVKEVSFTDPDATRCFRDHQRRGRPIVLRGAIPARSRWGIAHLEAILGETAVLARFYGHNKGIADKRDWCVYAFCSPVRFSDYADMLRSQVAHRDDIYLAEVALDGAGVDLQGARAVTEALGLRNGIGRFGASPFLLWCGPGGHVEPLHYDRADGTLMQFEGAKRVALFPPSDTASLYPFPIRSHIGHWFSQVNLAHPDFNAFPTFRQALSHRQDVVIVEGDVLFIPDGWWHEVEGAPRHRNSRPAR
jgi:lysine-specific demethylase 8/hypoxia-inducible factor 1-alpha inhibitor (HIF hydroxylase)